MFISLRQWRDLTDGHLYKPGDVFPHDGRQIAPERIAALVSGANKAHTELIVQAAENPTDENKAPQKAEKTAKSATRTRAKKA